MQPQVLCHTDWVETENSVSKCRRVLIGGAAGKGRPHQTWNQVVQNDLRTLHLEKSLAQDCNGWRDAITKPPSDPWQHGMDAKQIRYAA